VPSEVLFRMLVGFRTTQALYVAAKLGIADHLVSGPLDSNELARRVRVHPRALFRVMRALAALGVFTQDSSGRFGLTAIGELLRTDSHESLRYSAIAIGEEQYRAAGELFHTVRTGETAFNHLYGKGHFEYLAEHPEASKIFNAYMSEGLRRYGNRMESYDFKDRHFVVDVGGGRGDLIASVLRANPALEGILYDLPQGVAEAADYLESQGVANRCQIMTGSAFDSIPAGGDAYVMSRVLHDWPDEKAAVLLSNCRKAIAKGGTLLIRENVLPEDDTPSMGKQLDLTMLYMLGGAERTEAEWRNLLQASGFSLTRILKTKSPFDIIEAAPSEL